MILSNDLCTVTVSIDEQFTVNSADNKHYDMIYNLNNYRKSDHYTTTIINIDLSSKKISIALVGDYFSSDIDCALLDNEVLSVLQNRYITHIRVTDGSVVGQTDLQESASINYAIYKVPKGYILYGEIDIVGLSNDFKRKWTFSGRDIWASVTGKNPFEICEDRIRLYDFCDNYYEIDFDGKIIRDISAETAQLM
ncbi:MAG: hypothetical protein HDT44_12400 [Ruminococcaceae bacterium]|nr:hypothetical protein [Oscillospiraceae bacterium]